MSRADGPVSSMPARAGSGGTSDATSSGLRAVRCRGCGGAVAAVAGKPLPACLFCGADASDLVPFDPPESVEPPEGAIPFRTTDAEARAAFVAFAGSSRWYPSDLRQARLELRHLLLPAWAWSGELETHWTGLEAASTRSGKRPVSGSERTRFAQVLVPSSASLTLAELRELGAYDEGALVPFDPSAATDPYELSEMTRSAARGKAQAEMERRHQEAIRASRSLLSLRAASVADELAGRPVLVPVYIGAYRYGEGMYRVLVNGQTGAFIGKAPISWRKVIAAVLAGLAAIAALLGAVALCAGLAGLAGMSS